LWNDEPGVCLRVLAHELSRQRVAAVAAPDHGNHIVTGAGHDVTEEVEWVVPAGWALGVARRRRKKRHFFFVKVNLHFSSKLSGSLQQKLTVII